MRRVLFIHFHFLPVHNVAVKRLVGYLRHLPARGWQPSVLTHDWRTLDGVDPSWGLSWEPDIERDLGVPIHRVPMPAGTRFRQPRRDEPWPIRKARSLLHMIAGHYPDEFIAWARPARAAGLALARTAPFHAIVTYCPPETNHIVGSRLSRTLGVPWVPFFGDLNGFFLAPLAARSPGAMIRRAAHHRWMAPAAACAAASPYMAEYLSRTYGIRGDVVLTGFDPAEFEAFTPASPRSPSLLISHVGSIYPGNQQPEIFIDGLDRLLTSDPDLESSLDVRFVGSKCDAYLHALVANRPSARVCRILPKVSSPQAAEMVRESDVLLAFNCRAYRDGHGTMSYPTKVFEALGARRPILAIPPDDDWVDALLARTGGGATAETADEVASILWTWWSAWQRDGRVPYDGRPDALADLTHARQAERLASLLTAVSA